MIKDVYLVDRWWKPGDGRSGKELRKGERDYIQTLFSQKEYSHEIHL